MPEIATTTMRERLGALFASGLLAATMGAGTLGMPAPAWAADTATIAITVKDNAPAAKYNIYKLFDADIEPNAASETHPGIATHVSWNNDAKAATLAFLDANGYGAWLKTRFPAYDEAALATQHDRPQNAAEFIAKQIGASPNDAQAATKPQTKAARSFALELAKALDAAFRAGGATIYHAETTAADGTKASFTGTEGYYLFVTDDASLGPDEAGTSPIWVPLGGSTSVIQEKTAAPTFDKQVMDDSAGSTWGKAADANAAQDLAFKLTATLPDNIGAFDTYLLQFEDTLPAGLSLSGDGTSSVVVKVDGATTITGDLTGKAGSISYSGNKLVVRIDDIKTVHKNLQVGKDSTVTVEYRAHPNGKAAIGAGGNQNGAILKYTNNPVTHSDGSGPDGGGTGETTPSTSTLFTYRIDLTKVDKQTHENLAGAKFTVQVAKSNSDDASKGAYVQADGSLGADAHAFVTDAKGSFSIPRIDEGVYTIHETEAPAGYELEDADITLTVSRTFDGQKLASLSATSTGGEGTKTLATDIVTNATAEAATGAAKVVTSDDKRIAMPITGMDGVTAGIVFGTGAVVLGLAGWYATRRKRNGGAE